MYVRLCVVTLFKFGTRQQEKGIRGLMKNGDTFIGSNAFCYWLWIYLLKQFQLYFYESKYNSFFRLLFSSMLGSSYSLHHSISRDINYIHFLLALNFCCSYKTLYFFLTQNLFLDVIIIKIPFNESEDCNKLIMQNAVWLTSNNNKKNETEWTRTRFTRFQIF